MKPVIIIQGPTAVGKSSLALELAQKFNLDIISADSRQVYKYMDLATAKPTPEELALVKHHLIDVITPNEAYNAGRFAREATDLVDHSNLHTPIICGGTGFYISAFLEGLCNIPEVLPEIRDSITEDWDSLGNLIMYEKLVRIDPTVAQRVSNNDKQRIIRALEVFYGTGKKLSGYWEEQDLLHPRKVLNILLMDDRADIYARINKRYEEMVSSGLLDEIKHLLDMGYNSQSPGLTAVGYKELLPYILQKESLASCVNLAKQHSRNYAKRQITWYKRNNFNLVFFRKSIKYNTIDKFLKTFIDNDGKIGDY
jgi:tRNA dimethylallyltransferase